jgi:Spy/CpxP family protein refolding chaperone
MHRLKSLAAAVVVFVFACGSAHAVPQSIASPAVVTPSTSISAQDPDPGFTSSLLADMQKELRLTPAQIDRIRPMIVEHQIAENAYFGGLEEKLNSLLTAEQKAKLDALKARVAANPDSVKEISLSTELALTPEQMNEMRAYITTNRPTMEAASDKFFKNLRDVLTPEQQARLDQILATPTEESEDTVH